METRNCLLDPRPFSNGNFVPKKGVICVVGGGAFLSVCKYPEIAGCDVLLAFDVPAELNAISTNKCVIKYSLAGGESLGSLINSVDSPEKLKSWWRTRPAVSLSNGLGQLRSIGGLAAKKLLSDPAFRNTIVSDVFDTLMRTHNGELEEVTVIVLASSAGGTGSGIALSIADAISTIVRERSPALVHTRLFRIGGLSYVGCGSRLHTNTSGALIEDLTYCLSTNRHPREIRSIDLAELPMVGENKDARDIYAIQYARAMRCAEVTGIFDRSSVNYAIGSQLGGITIAKSGFWNTLLRSEVAGDVSCEVAPHVQALIETKPAEGVIKAIRVCSIPNDTSTPTTDQLMDVVQNVGGVKPANFDADCRKTKSYDVHIVVAIDGTEPIRIGGDFDRYCRIPCRNKKEYIERISTLRAIDKEIRVELQKRAQLVEGINRKQRAVENELQKAIRCVYPQSLTEKFITWAANPNNTRSKLRNGIIRYHEIANYNARTNSEIEALKSASARVEKELTAITSRLEHLIRFFDEIKPVSINQRDKIVNAKRNSLEVILAKLHTCDSDEDIMDLLASAANTVTLKGLAKIVGITNDQADMIIKQLSTTEPPVVAPWFAGRRPSGPKKTIIVLPSVEKHTAEELKQAMEMISANQIEFVISNAALGCGMNIVRLELAKPLGLEDLLTPLIRKYLQEVTADPDLYLTGFVPVDLEDPNFGLIEEYKKISVA